MKSLSHSYRENVEYLRSRLRPDKNFDVVERNITSSGTDMTLFFIDGFVKDGEMQRVLQSIIESSLGTAREALRRIPYVEIEAEADIERIIRAVLSGQTLLLSESFSSEAVLIDARSYPARPTGEPDTDKVMQGSHDGFTETLVMNTALIRRRVRDERLTFSHFDLGGASKTDVCVCYVDGVADEKLVRTVKEKIKNARPRSLTLGFQSLSETLLRRGWLNPFPKFRTTERPDTAAAELLEGRVLVICDTSPQVMILPTSIFDFVEETNDYYFPPLTGSYLRTVRIIILLFSVVATPLWYLYLEYYEFLPDALRFLLPNEPGALPILLQLLLVEIAVDGLKLASMNTPDMLSNSLSIVSALILGDFAVEVGWLSADVILYMAFVAIASFAQQNSELGYAMKFVRMLLLILSALLGIWGFAIGIFVFFLLLISNRTLLGRRYLYPFIPWSGSGILRIFVRKRKGDFNDEESKD